MRENDITHIRVHNNLIGVVGLKKIMEQVAKDYAGRSDDEIGMEITQRLSEMNYIPDRARDLYAHSLIREFRKFLGQFVEEAPTDGLRVVVLGPGCAQCSRLEMDVREVMAEMHMPGELLHVTDVREIGKYGIMGVPALLVNDKVVSVGTLPHRKKIKEWLSEASAAGRKE